jgi:hypothetical protein
MMHRKNGWAILGLVSLFCSTDPARAQMAMGSPPGWNAAMTRLFGDIHAFTAKAELRVLDKTGKESIRVPINFALLDRRVRMDIEMTQMKGPQAPPEQIASLKQLAMDRLACIIRPDTKMTQILFPSLTAYVEMPLPEEEAAALNADLKMEKNPLGRETIDGHSCAKQRVVMTDKRGQKFEFIVWYAADLKDFPLQAQLNDAGANVVIRYQNVQFDRPDKKQFDAPSGYTRHKDFIQLMQAAALKHGTNTPKKK